MNLGTNPVLIVNSYGEGEMYAEYLRSVGLEVDHVRTPEEALARMAGRPPVVIVTDMVFKDSSYDGPAFMRALRRRPESMLTYVIVVSGFVRDSDRRRARGSGGDLFLIKPCAPEHLWRCVDRALSAPDRGSRAEWTWPESA